MEGVPHQTATDVTMSETLVMEEMMILRNMVKIKELSLIVMQRELRILENMRGIKEIRVIQHRHPMIVLIQWEWLKIQQGMILYFLIQMNYV
jgi:hypothetical protein